MTAVALRRWTLATVAVVWVAAVGFNCLIMATALTKRAAEPTPAPAVHWEALTGPSSGVECWAAVYESQTHVVCLRGEP